MPANFDLPPTRAAPTATSVRPMPATAFPATGCSFRAPPTPARPPPACEDNGWRFAAQTIDPLEPPLPGPSAVHSSNGIAFGRGVASASAGVAVSPTDSRTLTAPVLTPNCVADSNGADQIRVGFAAGAAPADNLDLTGLARLTPHSAGPLELQTQAGQAPQQLTGFGPTANAPVHLTLTDDRATANSPPTPTSAPPCPALPSFAPTFVRTDVRAATHYELSQPSTPHNDGILTQADSSIPFRSVRLPTTWSKSGTTHIQGVEGISMRLSSLAAFAAGLCVTVAAMAETVSPTSPGNWGATAGSVTFESGPGTPPAGTGSLGMDTADGRRIRYGTSDFNGTALADIITLSYSTYVDSRAAGSVVAPSLNLFVTNGTTNKTLVFEPGYSGSTTTDAWQTWDALTGSYDGWWDTANGDVRYTWSELLGALTGYSIRTDTNFAAAIYNSPTNTIVGASNKNFTFQTGQGSGGSPWTGFAGNVDSLTFGTSSGTRTFDFEAAAAVPLPGVAWAGMALFGLVGAKRLRRRTK